MTVTDVLRAKSKTTLKKGMILHVGGTEKKKLLLSFLTFSRALPCVPAQQKKHVVPGELDRNIDDPAA